MAAKRSPPNRFPFTAERLRKLPTPGKGRVFHYDGKTPGLCLCVTETGTKTFYFYRKVDGRPERIRLGRSPEISIDVARAAAAGMAGEIAKGRDPAAERRARRQSPTLEDLFTHWMETHSKLHKKSWEQDVRQYEAYLKPWAGRRLSSIKRGDVQRLHAKLGTENGIYMANRVLALLRAMYNRADDLGYHGKNPTARVTRFKEKSRDRFLQPGELPSFFEALAAEPNPVLRGFFLICLLTGARRRNVEAMRWNDIDLGLACWRIPDTKRGEPQIVALSPPAIDVLLSLKPLSKGGWVFPGRQAKCGHLTEPVPAWKRILDRAKLTDLRIHDLRRSLGSWQALAGTSLQVIGATLGHTRPETTAIYSRLTLDPVRESVNAATTAMIEAGKITVDANGQLLTDESEGENDGE